MCSFIRQINLIISLSSFMMARISWLMGPMMNWQKALCKGSVQPSGCCTLVHTLRRSKVLDGFHRGKIVHFSWENGMVWYGYHSNVM